MTEPSQPEPDAVPPSSTSVPPPPPPPDGAPTPPPAPPSSATPPPPPSAAPGTPAAAAPPPPPPGQVAPTGVALFPNGKPMVDAQGRPASPKSRLAAALLAWFLGVLGIHRFYVGKIGTGILMIVTLGGLGIWVLIDFIVILVGSFKDKEDRYLANW
ncbi:MAG: TM2 domain-containing protein [Candidatus Nanopelagicales bacterium]